MNNKKLRSSLGIILTLLLIIVSFIAGGYYINSQRVLPLFNDEALHLISAIRYFHLFKDFSNFSLANLLKVDDIWPPFFHASSALLCIFQKKTLSSFLSINIFYLIILLGSVYLMARKINKGSAILSVCFLSAYPAVFVFFNCFMLEFALSAIVSFSMFCLLYSDNFTSRLFSILLGVSLGVGMLIKWTFCFFVIGPLLYSIVTSLRKQNKNLPKRNIIFCMLIGFLIACPWYATHSLTLINKIPNGFIRIGRTISFLSIEGIFFYPISIFCQISGFLFAIFLFSIFFIKKIEKKSAILLFSWILIPLIILILIPNMWSRHIFPVLPAFALISASGVAEYLKKYFFNKIANIALIVIMLIFLQINIIACFANIDNIDIGAYIFLKSGIMSYSVLNNLDNQKFWLKDYLFNVNFFSRNKALNYDNFKKLFAVIQDYKKCNKKALKIGIVDAESPQLFYFALINDIKGLELISFTEQTENFLRAFDRFDFLIFNSNKTLSEYSFVLQEIMEKEKLGKLKGELFDKYNDDFKRLKFELLNYFKTEQSYKVHNSEQGLNSTVYLLKNKSFPYADSSYKLSPMSYNPLAKEPFTPVLECGYLKLSFKDPKWIIYWRDKEITKNLSIYTSLRSFGIWNDSTSFIWNIDSVSKNKLTATGRSVNLPIYQIWYFEIRNNQLHWKVVMGVDRLFKLEREQTNIMLSDLYNRWETLKADGRFPTRFNDDYGGDWQVLHKSNKNKYDYLSVVSDSPDLPKVLMSCFSFSTNQEGMVINSDDMYKGRVLQYVKKHNDFYLLKPGVYDYFDGYFLIGDSDKKFVETILYSIRSQKLGERKNNLFKK